MTPVIKQSIEEMERALEAWNVEFHPKTHPFILSKEEQNVGLPPCDVTKLKCYYAALQLCQAEQYSSEVIRTTLESSSEVVENILSDAWIALRTGTDQTITITNLMMKLFPPTSIVKVDVPRASLYEELKQQISWEQIDYGLEAVAHCLDNNPDSVGWFACYLTRLAKKKFPDHDFVQSYDEESIFSKFQKQSIARLKRAICSEEALWDLLDDSDDSSTIKTSESEFVDPVNALENYYSYIERCIELFKIENEYYSRYVTLCQSAGYGKTRLCREMSRKFFLIFTCLRKPSAGEVQGESTIAEYFRKLNSVEEFLVFYLALFSVVDEQLSVDAIEGLIESQVANESDQGSSQDYLNSESAKRARKDSLGIHHKFSNGLLDDYNLNSTGGKFWYSVKTKAHEIFADKNIKKVAGTLHQEIEKVFTSLRARLEERNLFKSFVFIIDEARCLINGDCSAFLNWRLAVSMIDRSLPMFFVLLDTSTKLAKFAPVLNHDPATQEPVGGDKLFPPSYLIPFIDSVKLGKNNRLRRVRFEAIVDELDSATYAQYTPFKFSPLVVLEKSRPMFISTFYELERISWDSFYSEVMTLARGKLIRSARLNQAPLIEAESAHKIPPHISIKYMAAISCRVPLVPTNTFTSDTLASEYMATILDIDVRLEMVTAYYVPETILQEAAAHLLRAPVFFERSLQLLRDQLLCRQFSFTCSKDDLGEVAVSVCMLRAFDCLVPLRITKPCSDAFITPRTTHAFFRSLLGRERFDALGLNDSLPCGYLSFTKWYQIGCGISGQVLLNAFLWRCAIVCSPEEAEINLIIPCIKAGRERMQIDTAPHKLKDDGLTADDMFPIYIQVKNSASAFGENLIEQAMTSIVKANELGPKFDQYFSVIFQVGKGGMGCDHENAFMLSKKVESDSKQFLMIPSIKSLTSDSEVFSEAAKEQLRKTAQMDRMLDSKKELEERIGMANSPYCDKFYEQSYSEWSG